MPMNSYYIQKVWVVGFFVGSFFWGGVVCVFWFWVFFFGLVASSQFCSMAIGVVEMTKENTIWAAAGFWKLVY